MKIAIVNGPNLNLLGKREPGIYGNTTAEDCFHQLVSKYPQVQLVYFQSNVEGELINFLHANGFELDGIVLNAGAYTHTSIALRDAIAAITTPVVEVHISNVHAREEFRHVSMIAAKCVGVIAGLGMQGYGLAVEYFLGKQ
ncbi:type II 3-dehydroquinate dehydratase [Chitinophaga horti]|uniref:3-dehydroquinate dehydratase n=1 Tax=Chitinophaga horti TaxID=2920382 RepID=A0ABY6IZ66_9BACT|nr:type II 3-dehydroquinate dehydratase [Chitinophaga horti]UYQ91299.1 type II 3-dehydroquinate dehydratase [Chitinophaga horti]